MKNITVGKYTLESLTTGMYIDPLILFREYIQNSTDSIDEAIRLGINTDENSFINIIMEKENKKIIIEDNGCGIKKNSAFKVLTDIGNSNKRHSSHKGFRGIGRLSGLSYCNKLSFETSALNEDKKTIVTFDSLKLEELLRPGKFEEYGIEDVLAQITEVEYYEESIESHYFKVVLEGVNTKLNLLNEDKVITYLEETAPLPYDIKKFKFGNIINNELSNISQRIDEYNIYFKTERINKQLFKPYKRRIYVDIKKKLVDEITDVNIKVIKNDSQDKNVALVWYGKCQLLGSIVDDRIKGLRVRKSGILIGDRFLANEIFKEDRFNGWVIGEIVILDNDIIPNARRDDFEKNDAYLFLMKELKKIGQQISSDIRESSKKRNNNLELKTNNIKTINNKLSDKKNIRYDKEKVIIDKIDDLINKIYYKDEIIDSVNKILINNNVNNSIVEQVIKAIKKLNY